MTDGYDSTPNTRQQEPMFSSSTGSTPRPLLPVSAIHTQIKPIPTSIYTPLMRLLHLPRALVFFPQRWSLSVSPMADSVTSVSPVAPRPPLRGVVFDMDGTLTVPVIDFPAMYRAVLGEKEYISVKARNPTGIDILHHIENWKPEDQRRAYETITDFERQGLDRLQIMPGAAELCEFLDSNKIRRGLITRNVKAAVDLFHQRFGLMFDPALSREFRPYKPDPAPLLHICSTWEVQSNEVMMVGDSLKDDVVCGKRAGAYTCLLDEKGRYSASDFADSDTEPDFKVASLTEVHKLLGSNFDLTPASTPNQCLTKK